MFLVSKATLKTANRQYSNLNNDYEMTLNHESQIITIHEDNGDVPQIKYNFVPLSEIEGMEKESLVGECNGSDFTLDFSMKVWRPTS